MYRKKIFFYFLIIIFTSCANKNFIIYQMNGDLDYAKGRNRSSNSNIELYFDKSDIKLDYMESNIIATNNFYYGQFFF